MKSEMLKIQKEAVKYLESNGYSVVVVGQVKIQHQPGQLRFNNELVIEFTGGKKKL